MIYLFALASFTLLTVRKDNRMKIIEDGYKKNNFEFSVVDGLAVDWRHLLRPANRSGRRDEYQRSPIHLPYQYDLPECLRSH